jgi:DNA polymerase
MDIFKQLLNCQKCSLVKWLPTGCKPVLGCGPHDAKLVFIAEAPGADEAIMEEPLVGQCGKLFDKMLKEAHIKREACYIDNIVHCRPTDDGRKNRAPTQEEVNMCKDWTISILTKIQPKIVVTMGKVATYTLLSHLLKKNFTLGPMVGKLYKNSWLKGMIIPVQHPSYLMQYGKAEMQKTIQIFSMAKILSEETTNVIEPSVRPSIESIEIS